MPHVGALRGTAGLSRQASLCHVGLSGGVTGYLPSDIDSDPFPTRKSVPAKWPLGALASRSGQKSL